MSFLDKIHLEWWQALLPILLITMRPLFKAVAVILVARFVKPELAKVALPLILSGCSSRDRKVPQPNTESANVRA
jgi:hypothetical protein